MRQMAQDIELARNSARMLAEAVSFADPEMEAIEENELIKVQATDCCDNNCVSDHTYVWQSVGSSMQLTFLVMCYHYRSSIPNA